MHTACLYIQIFQIHCVSDLYKDDCSKVIDVGSGIYNVYPHGSSDTPMKVFCNQTTDGGGWLVSSGVIFL